jgi:hypothetical protein
VSDSPKLYKVGDHFTLAPFIDVLYQRVWERLFAPD